MKEEQPTYKKKLIEVAIPLGAINNASLKEKSIRQGHPSTIHLYWARRPLSTCRAIIFSSIIDDPSEHPELFPTPKEVKKERQRLFQLMERFVKWENINDKKVLQAAINEIKKQSKKPLALLDPFCGGGSIPLEAQRLGLEAYGSDINPVAVLITKSLIELPQLCWDMEPINPESHNHTLNNSNWKGTAGLIEDIKYYGAQLRDMSENIISEKYPPYEVTADLLKENKILLEDGHKIGDKIPCAAWVWARTVYCNNPACNNKFPLVRSFTLSSKLNKEIYVKYSIEKSRIRYTIHKGTSSPLGTINRNGATCPFCNQVNSLKYIREQFQEKRDDVDLLAVIAEGTRKKLYLSPPLQHIEVTKRIIVEDNPAEELQGKCKVSVPLYGMRTFGDLFTSRQLLAITTLINCLPKVHANILSDCSDSRDKEEYAKIISTYLAFAITKGANYWSSLCAWHSGREVIMSTFGRQALAMVWDFTEANPFGNSSGNFYQGIKQICKVVANSSNNGKGNVLQLEVCAGRNMSIKPIVSTDPPYYDNICYADLSDFFYIWFRRSLTQFYPDLFSTLLTPKKSELIASPFRFKSKKEGKEYFEQGMADAFAAIKKIHNDQYPLTVFYAFKQSEHETNDDSLKRSFTGWETMLEGLLKAGFMITGTLPVRTELITSLKKNVSALASSIVIVCRPKSKDSQISTRREFITTLKKELPSALKSLQEAGIAPVDMAQSAIGPGMAVFSRYSKILEADGTPMSVRTVLQIINQELDSYFSEQEADMDKETRFCISWYEQYCWKEGPFGDANTLSNAKGTAVNALDQAGVIYAKAGKVRLLKRTELDINWDPTTDKKLTVWECVQYLIKALEDKGEAGAAEILKKIGGLSEPVKELAYRLYALCEKKGWTEDALAYNSLISSWQTVTDKAQFAAEVSESTKKKIKEKSQKKLTDI